MLAFYGLFILIWRQATKRLLAKLDLANNLTYLFNTSTAWEVSSIMADLPIAAKTWTKFARQLSVLLSACRHPNFGKMSNND